MARKLLLTSAAATGFAGLVTVSPMARVHLFLTKFVLVSAIPKYLLDEGFTGSVDIAETAIGRGLVATSDLGPGDEVLSVPLRHLVSVDTVKLNESMEISDLPMADALASILAASRYSKTFLISQLLPTEVSHPLFFGPKDWEFVDSLVSADLLKSLSHEFSISWQRVQNMALDERDFRWAHAILRSRGHSVRLKSAEGAWQRIWGLVPLADLLNMGDDLTTNVDCRTRYPQSTWGLNGTFTCTARRSLLKNETLLTDYISKKEHRTSAVLLREYGFVPVTADGLSFFPTDCQKLHCAVHIHDIEQLERHITDPDAFLASALQKNSLLPIESSVDEALKRLAAHERKILLDLSREYERRKLPKVFYDLWRQRELPEAPSELLKLRDPDVLHTIAWDQALWDAGKRLLSEWDDILAAELLYSHHDFPPDLELLFRRRRQELLKRSFENDAPSFAEAQLYCAFTTQALLNDEAWPVSNAEQELLKRAKIWVRSMYHVQAHGHQITIMWLIDTYFCGIFLLEFIHCIDSIKKTRPSFRSHEI